nr:hypothetical protein [Pandoravirus belohorizontensis]
MRAAFGGRPALVRWHRRGRRCRGAKKEASRPFCGGAPQTKTHRRQKMRKEKNYFFLYSLLCVFFFFSFLAFSIVRRARSTGLLERGRQKKRDGAARAAHTQMPQTLVWR